mmetsp:Transcript_8175/g.12435  ORF Transcript_8175/g.12435 Transcript_8175/m.12435 type:complete len:241 (+) Transcript_8175:936-1658(+)
MMVILIVLSNLMMVIVVVIVVVVIVVVIVVVVMVMTNKLQMPPTHPPLLPPTKLLQSSILPNVAFMPPSSNLNSSATSALSISLNPFLGSNIYSCRANLLMTMNSMNSLCSLNLVEKLVQPQSVALGLLACFIPKNLPPPSPGWPLSTNQKCPMHPLQLFPISSSLLPMNLPTNCLKVVLVLTLLLHLVWTLTNSSDLPLHLVSKKYLFLLLMLTLLLLLLLLAMMTLLSIDQGPPHSSQ